MDETVRVHLIREKDRQNLTMRYRDPVTGKHVKKSSGTSNQKEALKLAAQWEAAINESRYRAPLKTTWDQFRDRYEVEHLARLAAGTQDRAKRALDLFEQYMHPRLLRDVTASRISQFQATLRDDRKIEETTIAAHLRHLKAALRWAEGIGIMAKAPKIAMPKRVKGGKLMKGRPITTEEFERMLSKVPEARPKDAGAWKRFLTGLWLSGLRLRESLLLSWDEDADFAVDLSGRHPRFRIAGKAQKSGQAQLLPMTPDFAEWLLDTPEEDRQGLVFSLSDDRTGRPLGARAVGDTISRIGEKAQVLVDKAKRKYASAHDLRRGFGTRWAKRVMPATLQLLMRHADIATTTGFYVGISADEVASDLWANYAQSVQEGTGLGAMTQSPARNRAVRD